MLALDSIGFGPAAFILVTIGIGALIKGVTGVGLPIFAVPALSMFLPVEHAVIIMALPGIVANVWLVIAHREQLPVLQSHRQFLAAGFAGALCGTWLLVTVSDVLLKLMLAAWLGYYLARHFFGAHPINLRGGSALVSGATGFVGGACQGSMGISAPVIAPYFHSYGLPPTAFAFAVAFTFGMLAISQTVALFGGGLFTPALLGYGALATLATALVIPLGIYLGSRVDRETFNRLIPGVLVLIEIKLVTDVLRAWS